MPFPLDCEVSAGSERLDHDSIDRPQKKCSLNELLSRNLLRCGLSFVFGLNFLAGEIACRSRCLKNILRFSLKRKSLKNILRFCQMYLTMCGKKWLFLFAPSSFSSFLFPPVKSRKSVLALTFRSFDCGPISLGVLLFFFMLTFFSENLRTFKMKELYSKPKP